jgi:Fe-Mn family superoxide dismutase
MGGPGWALLTRNRRDGKLHTYFVAEHHLGLPIEQDLLVVLDSWEHAFMVDYGIARAKYLETFVENIKWSEVSKRFGK